MPEKLLSRFSRASFTLPHLRFLSPRASLSLRSLHNFIAPTSQKSPLTLSRSVAAATAMDSSTSSTPCKLVLCGKSSAENEIAKSLMNNNNLKLPDNVQVSILLHSEIINKQQRQDEESFCIERFMNSLSTNRFGRLLIWSPILPSTHDVVSNNFGELPIGTVCVADVQYKGRGRSKNVWESPAGCLMFSFTIQMEDGRVVPLLQYVVSLAVTEAIKDVCDKNGLPRIDVRIKWPNDLYLNGLKVGGILSTSTYKSKKFNVSTGIGLNVDNEKPTTCLNAVLRELSAAACTLRREDIVSAFLNKFEIFYDLFINGGFQTLEELYYKTWLHSGQRVIIQEKNENQVVENVVTIQGLTSSGYLLAIGEDNQMCELHPDGNSFDFFKGLVRRKLE
ncbi:PREDICTED: biotin--protein ligase 2-like isoform X2 [Populus euphratica]|uniref:Biotin--protein ligase 2-like isoform X2 n=1 Tax=Populus euphratica TaxID=75702 RepID=A0AAJ6UCV4_POPEU|nr:PREDICTED: biotin--protein ligase 2-like isoform X2 [Populus euphratica]